MSREHKSPTDPLLESESPDVIARVDNFERRLRATRPRSPQLDLAALQQIANDNLADMIVERAPARKPLHSLPRGTRRISGGMLAIASSWFCGAGVGAIVVFVLMSRATPQPDQKNHIVRIEPVSPALIAGDSIANGTGEERDPVQYIDRPAMEKSVGRDVHGTMLTIGRDPFRQLESTFLSEGRMLQAGMYLKQNGERPIWPDQGAINKQRDRPDQWTSSIPAPPEPPVTRRELMRELLGESAAVL